MFYLIFIINSCYGEYLINNTKSLETVLNHYKAGSLNDVIANLVTSEDAARLINLLIKEDLRSVFLSVVLKKISQLLTNQEILSIIEGKKVSLEQCYKLYNEDRLEENSFVKLINILSFFVKLYSNQGKGAIFKQFFKNNASDIIKRYLEIDWDIQSFSKDLNFFDIIQLFILSSNFLDKDSFIFKGGANFSIFEKQQLLTLIQRSKIIISEDNLPFYAKGMKSFILKFIKSLNNEVDKLTFIKPLNDVFTLEELYSTIYVDDDTEFTKFLRDIRHFDNMVGYIKCTVRDIDEKFTDEDRKLLILLSKVSSFSDLNLFFLKNGHLIHQELLIKDKIEEAVDFIFFVSLGWDHEEQLKKLLVMKDFFNKLSENLIFSDKYFNKIVEYSILKGYLVLTKLLLT